MFIQFTLTKIVYLFLFVVSICLFFFLIHPGDARAWTHSFVLARQSATPPESRLQPFCSWLFWSSNLAFCPGQTGPRSFYFMLPSVACSAMPSFSHWDGVLQTYFFAWTGLEPQSSPSYPSKHLGMTGTRPPCPTIDWDEFSLTFCLGWPGTILRISASQVARITGVSHWCPAPCFILSCLWVSMKKTSLCVCVCVCVHAHAGGWLKPGP
jgi:hypothetical protein